MTNLRLIGIATTLMIGAASVSGQQQEAGTADYALANSSVMWIPTSSALFLNPSELGRLHQDEFLVTSGRFRSLASMSSALFVPGTGTFGVGVAPTVNSAQYRVGFGRLVGDYNTAGSAISVTPNSQGSVRFILGGSIHFPSGEEETGAHAAVSVSNLPSKALVNTGAAYWLLPNLVRIQLATETRTQRAEFVGAEVRVLEGFHIQIGTRGFNKALGGASYASSYATVELGAGPEGISFSMKVRIGNAASDSHDEAYNQGDEAYADQRYGDAREYFLEALRYNEYDNTSRLLAEKSRHMVDSSVTMLLQEASTNENQKHYAEAMRAYSQILRIDPQQTVAASNLANVEKRLKLYVHQLLIAGDSLKNVGEISRARKSYELAAELDPENDSVSVRIDELENLSKENIRSMLSKARSLLRRSELDDAQQAFERILTVEPGNTQARSGLRTIDARRINEQLTLGQAAYDAHNYFEALDIFIAILQKDGNNKDAKQFLEKTRDMLKSEVDGIFKKGLQFFIKEDFKSAISAWDKVLMIQPGDSSTIEYRKRAEEKLKALEQFK